LLALRGFDFRLFFLQNPAVLLLDEATSALDSESESMVLPPLPTHSPSICRPSIVYMSLWFVALFRDHRFSGATGS
jgi:hypothetical protein